MESLTVYVYPLSTLIEERSMIEFLDLIYS